MLDNLIVLGQVPGTNYFLTFTDILIIAEVLLILPLVWKYRNHLHFQWTRRYVKAFNFITGHR